MVTIIQSEQISYGKLTRGLQGSLGGGAGSLAPHSIGSEKLKLGSVVISRAAQIGTAIIAPLSLQYLTTFNTVLDVTATGTYEHFYVPGGGTLNFDGAPTIALACEGTIGACLDHPAAASGGSFMVKLNKAGTKNVEYIAIGPII